MDGVEPLRALRISSIQLNVANLERSVAFYEAGLGFAVEKREAAAVAMTLGGERLNLVQAPRTAVPYPPCSASNDPWFQHFAIRVTDMPAAYAQLMGQQPTPISIGGPQQLPASTGSAIAYKFRDPDGHPLELSFVPGGPPRAPGSPLFLIIDHSALAVADLEKSLGFWVGLLGFRETGRLLNQGPTQWRLDGLKGAVVDIVVLEAAEGGPHVELLHYRGPLISKPARRFRLTDISSTRLRILASPSLARREGLSEFTAQPEVTKGLVVTDPDGHVAELRVRADPL